ncbi:MAG: hypothetical protein EAZ91_01090 [Cytophagales bacterium]|nr:MAG: hypothetical protein EAZ91_01090 [Cytophagales bacterium]
MAYRDFTLDRLSRDFGVTDEITPLFDGLPLIEPSHYLLHTLATATGLPLRSEKARSEYIVTPILFELLEQSRQFFMLYSGEVLNIDRERGLTGETDFYIAKRTNTYSISMPLMAVVEAPRRDFDRGIPQCAAQMLAARQLNMETGLEVPIYGCVTTGTGWQFLHYNNHHLIVDPTIYQLDNLPQLLGVFSHILSYYRYMLNSQNNAQEAEIFYRAFWG